MGGERERERGGTARAQPVWFKQAKGVNTILTKHAVMHIIFNHCSSLVLVSRKRH